MAEPYVKIYKKMLDWEWYDDPNTCRLFIHCLLKVNWKPCKWHGIEIEPGQFVTSLQNLADETCLTIRQVRVALSHLKMTGEVTITRHSKCSVITVNNWSEYQTNDKQNVTRKSIGRQSDDNQMTTDKEYKEYKNKYIYYSDPNLEKAFSDFVAMRKKIRKPMSDRAVELAIDKLDILSGGDVDLAIKIINQSIMNSYQGLFPLKEDTGGKVKNVQDFPKRKYDYAELENIAMGDVK